jgi:hypothetical protein
MAEKESVILSFVKHYIKIGAMEIFIYLDHQNQVEKLDLPDLSDYPQVSVFECDNSFWEVGQKQTGQSVTELDKKLVKVFRDAIEKNSSEWLLFCDADEFLSGPTSFNSTLSRLPESLKGVRIRNTEAVWATGSAPYAQFSCDYERVPFPKTTLGRIILPWFVYGAAWRELSRGTTGHVQGKHILRKGAVPDRMTSHSSFIEGEDLPFLHVVHPPAKEFRIVHFDALSYERWVEKWCRRLQKRTISDRMGRARRRQLDRISLAFSSGNALKMFETFNTLNSYQRLVLSRLKLLHPRHDGNSPSAHIK